MWQRNRMERKCCTLSPCRWTPKYENLVFSVPELRKEHTENIEVFTCIHHAYDTSPHGHIFMYSSIVHPCRAGRVIWCDVVTYTPENPNQTSEHRLFPKWQQVTVISLLLFWCVRISCAGVSSNLVSNISCMQLRNVYNIGYTSEDNQ